MEGWEVHWCKCDLKFTDRCTNDQLQQRSVIVRSYRYNTNSRTFTDRFGDIVVPTDRTVRDRSFSDRNGCDRFLLDRKLRDRIRYDRNVLDRFKQNVFLLGRTQ